jgi:hypothetical protein
LFGRGSAFHFGISQTSLDGLPADAELPAQNKDTGSIVVGRDDLFCWKTVLDVGHEWFSGLAFDCTTETGLYNSDGYVVHNCRCAVYAWHGRTQDAFDPNEGRDPHGQWIAGFVSPNVGELTFVQAKQAMSSRRQEAVQFVSRGIDEALGLHTKQAPVIGAWADGAENSLMTLSRGDDPELERAALAIKGYLADQKQVLMFREHADGQQAMAEFKVHGNIDEIHAKLLKDGIAFHTLEPHVDGTVVHVFSDSAAGLEQVLKTAQGYGSTVTIRQGSGEFLGTQKSDGSDREQRDDARAQYARVIEQSAAARPLVARTWDYYRNSWLPRLAQITDRVGLRTSLYFADLKKQKMAGAANP